MWQSPSGPNSRVRCVLYPTTALEGGGLHSISNNFHKNLCNSIKYPFILHVIKAWTKTGCCNWDMLIKSKMPFFLLLTIWNICQMEQTKNLTNQGLQNAQKVWYADSEVMGGELIMTLKFWIFSSPRLDWKHHLVGGSTHMCPRGFPILLIVREVRDIPTFLFLAVKKSYIGHLVTHSLTHIWSKCNFWQLWKLLTIFDNFDNFWQ